MLKKWGIATLAMMLVVFIVWMVSNQGKVTAGGEDANDNNIETSAENTETVSGNDERILLIARYDNLGKGASGAALECMNISMGATPSEMLDLL